MGDSAREIDRIRYELTLPVQSQFIRNDLRFVLEQLEQAELCANCTPERDHNGVLCRKCANVALEQAERERDEWRRQAGREGFRANEAEARLVKADTLSEALEPFFGKDGSEHPPLDILRVERLREIDNAIRKALAAFEQEQKHE